MICVSFATASRDFAAYGEEAVLEETEKLKTDLVGEPQFEDTKERMLDEYVEAFRKSSEVLADMIIAAASNGDEELVRLHDFERRMKKLKPKKLCDVANKYFTKHYARVLIRPA
jgi:predicted Zn-dependent peptidase